MYSDQILNEYDSKDIIDTYDITKIKTTRIALIVLFNLNDFESYLVMLPGVP